MIHRAPCRFAISLAAAALLVACSKPESAALSNVAITPSAASTVAPANQRAMACAMVPQEAMSAILGAAVIAKPNDRSNGQSQCVYSAASGLSPHADLKVEWGMGPMAMKGVGIANQAEPGLANAFDGLGDQAAQIGPALMIRSGEDLVTIVFSGVDDALPKARKIFDLVKARL